MNSNPVECGRTLEDIVHLASLKIPNIKSYREYDIRNHFEDPSLNGVDHWLMLENTHILIQDKWRETTSQPEVAQFLQCTQRISSRLPKEDKIYLIWCSKKEPTSFSLAMLLEKSVNIVICGTTIENLARLCILQVCDCFQIDPIPSLVEIRSFQKSMDRSKLIVDMYDDSQDRRDLNTTIHKIHKLFQTVYESIESEDLKSFVSSFIPNSSDFTKYAKVDFNFFLKSLKPLCVPTKTKKFSSELYIFYAKMRKGSIQLTILANEYETKRKAFSKKSSWAKTLCLIKCIPEPISEVEYNSTIIHCSDYYIDVERSDSDTTRVVSIAGSKRVNPLLENSFSKTIV
jgi:hypothetical protein